MKISTEDLLNLPIGSIFHEDEYCGQLFEKTDESSKGMDIIVKTFGRDAEEHRMGISEMSDCDKRSREWCVMTNDELEVFIGRMMFPQIFHPN